MSEYEQIPSDEMGRNGTPLLMGQTDGSNDEPDAVNPLLVIHNLLKGRYLWALGMSVILGGALAYVGYKVPVPVYTSRGLIRIHSYQQRILYDTDKTQMMPMFDTFLDSQVALMKSERVTTYAMQSEDWRARHREPTADPVSAFSRNLTVNRMGSSDMIEITFTDPDPDSAVAGARAVAKAYEDLASETDLGSDKHRMELLDGMRTSLTSEIKGYQDAIQSIGSEFGDDALEEVHSYKISQMTIAETELNKEKLILAAMGPDGAVATTEPSPTDAGTADAGATVDTPDPTAHRAAATTQSATTQKAAASTQPKVWTLEEMAKVDSTLASLLSEKRSAEDAIAGLLLTKNEEHKDVQHQRKLLERIETDIKNQAAVFVPPVVGSDGQLASLSPADRYAAQKAKVERLQRYHDDVRAEAVDLGRKAMRIKALREDVKGAQSKLDDVKKRIDQLTVEASSDGGRVTVVSGGDRPGTPSHDPRQEFAAAGAMGGTGIGVGIALLLGVLDRRLKSSIDTQSKQMRKVNMLGVLPHLPDDMMDSESGEFAANCVHGIRAALQVASGGDRRAYAITSPASGDGKTSLVLALGMSFAASGAKTLLIDCDLIGGGLSHRVQNFAKMRLKTLLLMQGIVSKDHIRMASEHAKEHNITFNESLVQLGYLSQEQLDLALNTQPDRRVGLLDVLDGEPLNSAVQGLGMPHLSVLTLGDAEAHHVGRLSPAKLRKIILAAKKHFDAVLVDTGPVLGSLEAVMVSGQTDQAVLVVSRGSQRELATRSLDRLHMAGARMAGLIFNRAEERDASHASSTSHPSIMSMRSVSASGMTKVRALPDVRKKYERLGPLASVVAVSTSDDTQKEDAE